LNADVVNEAYMKKVNKFKTNTSFEGMETCAFYWANILGCIILGPLSCLVYLCSSCYIIEPMEAYVFTSFNKVRGVEKKQGLHCQPVCMRERQKVDLKVKSLIVESNIPDMTGSPMDVKAMVNYRITDPIASTMNVGNVPHFVQTQAFDTVLRICGKFPYKAHNNVDVSLLGDAHHIAVQMRELLQKKCEIAGVEIMRADFIDLSYSTAMTMSLLQVQKAEARLDARSKVVEGAVSITHDAINTLNDSEIGLSAQSQMELASSLMTLTCSDDGNV